uniref:Hsp70-interacting protein N-terminal domain-containing protein n=1 Tax=Astyanax mexicanus TaxID=7994 RepID=A0A8B9H8L2_ASTMX
MDPKKVSELKAFVQLCTDNPAVLHLPEMGFFRTWLHGALFGVNPSTISEGEVLDNLFRIDTHQEDPHTSNKSVVE